MNIYEKLTAIQKDLKASKKETNNFGGYKYRTIESIFEGVKPLLAKNEVTLILSDDLVQIGDRFYVKASAKLIDSEGLVEATAFAREPLTKKGTDESQITGAATTYARKYALTGLFLLDNSENDPDSEEYQKKVRKNTSEQEAKTEAKQDPEFTAAYEDFKGVCADRGLSAAAVARELKLNRKSTAAQFKEATDGLRNLIAQGADLSKWRA